MPGTRGGGTTDLLLGNLLATTQMSKTLAESLKVHECAVALCWTPPSPIWHLREESGAQLWKYGYSGRKAIGGRWNCDLTTPRRANNLGIIVAARREFPEVERLFRWAMSR